MLHSQESKIILLDGKAVYISVVDKMKGLRSKVSKSILFQFAEKALEELKYNCPSFLGDGLVRIDVFMNSFGVLVVNEIESLNATYYGHMNDEAHVSEFMKTYWKNQIERALNYYG